jgi:hypothetical protein
MMLLPLLMMNAVAVWALLSACLYSPLPLSAVLPEIVLSVRARLPLWLKTATD